MIPITAINLSVIRCVEAIRSSAYGPLAADLEINKAMVFLHNRETLLAIDTLKVFENNETKANSAASTMLSFVYFLVSINEILLSEINFDNRFIELK